MAIQVSKHLSLENKKLIGIQSQTLIMEFSGTSLPPGQFVYIDIFPLCGKYVHVKVLSDNVTNTLKYIGHLKQKQDLASMYHITFINIIEFDDKLFDKVKAGDKDALSKWDNFCTDVIIAYSIRYHHTREPIPITVGPGQANTILAAQKSS